MTFTASPPPLEPKPDPNQALRPAALFPDGFLGVVMLDTRFPRLPGDVGHPDAFGVPTQRCIVKGAWPDKIVQSAAGLRAGRLVTPIVQLVRRLEQDGAKAITTSCGFLVLLQKDRKSVV